MKKIFNVNVVIDTNETTLEAYLEALAGMLEFIAYAIEDGHMPEYEHNDWKIVEINEL